ncbi:MAG TPA: sigma-70 family RNA polymerase sigma factor [Magnetospirillaceae bacterium]|nr:sigma-70 family RNA polymerase sigma factor [Magnetospirillaceae bacterium]
MMNEQKIIKDILHGKPDRYADLVERYHIGLIIHCEHIMGNRDDAEDIAQETLIKAFDKLPKFDSNRARFSTWLYKIATNTALDYLRKHKRQFTVEDIEELAGATEPTYLEDAERAEVRKAVIALTPPEYRHIIEAYYWQGKSYKQIAAELDKPLNTISSSMRRAKAQLKEALSWVR